jgi:DNA-binding NtrC family response regulator
MERRQMPDETSPAAEGPARVLVITTDVEFVEDMRAVLHARAVIRHVASTALAVAEILRERPDLVWLDLDLVPFFTDSSGLEGLGFLEVLRKRVDPNVPVLVTSSQADLAGAAWMDRLQVTAWLPKPPGVKTLLEILTRLLSSRHSDPAASGNTQFMLRGDQPLFADPRTGPGELSTDATGPSPPRTAPHTPCRAGSARVRSSRSRRRAHRDPQ